MHLAALSGRDAVVEWLLAAGASVDAVNKYGRGLGAGRVDPGFLHKSVGIFTNFQRPDTLSDGRETGSCDGVGVDETCALALHLEGWAVHSFGRIYLITFLKVEDLLRVS